MHLCIDNGCDNCTACILCREIIEMVTILAILSVHNNINLRLLCLHVLSTDFNSGEKEL